MAAKFEGLHKVAQHIEDVDESGDGPNLSPPAQFEGENLSAEPGVTARIREAVKAAGGFSQVAARALLPARTLSRLLAGQEPKLSHLLALASATSVRLEWLATGHGAMHGGDAILLEDGAPLLSEDQARLPPGTLLIPRYDVRAAAGAGTGLDTGPVIESVAFPAAFIAEHLRRDPAHLAVITCAGDSMEPALRDGDELLVDTSRTVPRSGPIYILRVGGALLAKRLQLRVDGSVLILSDNPRYPPESLRPSEETPLDIVGEVVWRGGPMRL